MSFLTPARSLFGFAPSLIEVNEPLADAIKIIPAFDVVPVSSRGHALITFDEQGFGFRVVLLSGQAGA